MRLSFVQRYPLCAILMRECRSTYARASRSMVEHSASVLLFVVLLTGVTWVAAHQVQAQQHMPVVSSVRLYIFDCGRLKSPNPQVLLDHGVATTDMAVTAYLIVHPRGTLLWDTCVIPDDMIKPEGTTEARATASKTLRGQLVQIGYKPDDITYLALSHSHYDHSANANEFASSTWLVSKAERDFMFPDPPPPPPSNPGSGRGVTAATAASRYSALKDSKTKLIEGNYDVFGDGTVIIVPTPGHTPGHQSLLVKLAKTGPVILAGDLYHYPAEVTDRAFNPYGSKTSEMENESRAKIDALMKQTGAQLWISHDLLHFETLKISPQYYD
jgi:N-acyl homoserine lactone hydrolase